MPKEKKETEETEETEESTKEEKEEAEEKIERYSLEQVPTEYAQVIRDNENNIDYAGDGILLEILNKLNKVEKAVA